MGAIERKLKRDPVFNPFNDSFDYGIVQEEVHKYQVSGKAHEDRIIGTALSTGVVKFLVEAPMAPMHFSFLHAAADAASSCSFSMVSIRAAI